MYYDFKFTINIKENKIGYNFCKVWIYAVDTDSSIWICFIRGYMQWTRQWMNNIGTNIWVRFDLKA